MTGRARLRLREATGHSQPTQWGVYVERYDHGAWTPLIHDACTQRQAHEWLAVFSKGLYRNVRLVSRTVTPWAVAE